MNIYNKIEFHFLYYIVALIAIITGFFKEFIIFNSIILIHELGHIIISQYYHWNIDKILILPFGAITIFKEKINRSMKEELLIAIAGITIQMILYIFLTLAQLSHPIYEQYHWAIILFNILPIYPLDGSKILNLIISHFLPFRLCHLISIWISIIFLIFILTIQLDLLSILISICLIQKIIYEIYYHKNLFQRFLLERYLYSYHFKKRKYFNHSDVKKMVRGHTHLFRYNNQIITEKEMLRKKFDFSYYI